ncbi:MAG: hypothetical protein R6U44_05675 [Archaeoglobaceae archaeon]
MSTIEQKIEWAEDIYARFGHKLLEDKQVQDLLKRLEENIEATYLCMDETGVSEECALCAQRTGSCCGKGIEDKCDKVTLLINLLMGVELPNERELEDGCFFQGPNGCKLLAREVICINYLCVPIHQKVGQEDLIRLQEVGGEEMDTLFALGNRIKLLLNSWGAREKMGL